MSIITTQWAFNLEGLASPSKFILVALGDAAQYHAEHHAVTCWPRRSVLMRRTGLSRTAVAAHLKKLESEGLIKRVGRIRENGSKTSTRYILNVPHDLLDELKRESAQKAKRPAASARRPSSGVGRHETGGRSSRDLRGAVSRPISGSSRGPLEPKENRNETLAALSQEGPPPEVVVNGAKILGRLAKGLKAKSSPTEATIPLPDTNARPADKIEGPAVSPELLRQQGVR